MFQIDQPTAVENLPVISAPGPREGYFTDGSPSGSIPPTVVPAEFLNTIMMELVNTIKGAGLTLDKGDRTQLLQAIQTLFAGNALLKSQNLSDLDNIPAALDNLGFVMNFSGTTGYVRFPGGLIIQGGLYNNAEAAGTTWVFPVPFPSKCWAVLGIDGGGAAKSVGADNIIKESCTFYQRDVLAAGALVGGSIYAIAFGN